MRKLINLLGAGMGILLLSAVVAYAGDNVPKPPFPLNFDPGIFDKTSATIDNEWWPLKPGKQMTWEGSAFEGGEKIRRKVVFTVTDLTKEIAGVRTLVGWDRDYQNDELTESELIFLAQAKDGTVWHLGESVEHYENRPELKSKEHFDGTRIWLVGYLEGAKAGIYMPAVPKLGSPPYSQGFAPHPWDWDDWGVVYQVGQKTCVPVDCYSDVLVIREWEPSDPDVSQLKYYARGVGTVRIGWLGEEDEERETLELVKLVTLTPEALAEVRAAVLAHESRSYMYSLTPPAQVRKISDEKAKEIALQAVPGDVTAVAIEKKLGANRFVVEVIAKEDGIETDVIIDMETGEVLGTEK